jgi:hypothetical protein
MVMDFMEYGELCLCLRSLDIQSRQNNQFMVALLMIIVNLQAKLKEALSAPVEALLDGARNETWPAIRKLLRRETEAAVSGLSGALSGFDMDEQTKDKMLATIEDYARGIVEAKAREEAGRALIRMKDR